MEALDNKNQQNPLLSSVSSPSSITWRALGEGEAFLQRRGAHYKGGAFWNV